MRYKLILTIIPAVFLLALDSCCKRKVYCQSGKLDIGFVGFPYSEIRSLVLRRYDVDDTVKTRALDSAQLTYQGAAATPGKKDTVWLSEYNSNGVISEIYYGNDYTIRLSSAGQLFTVNAILDEEHRSEVIKCGDKEASCTNNVSSFVVNGSWTPGNRGYIVR